MVYVNSVCVSPDHIKLKTDSWYYNASVEICPSDATNQCVTWHSDNTSVATVNASNGYIYAKAVGTARVYATAADGSGCSGYMTVTVSDTIEIDSITLNRSSVSIEQGNCYSLSAMVCPENATNKELSWSSSNTSVATVSNGVVCAVANGVANITVSATDGSGKSAICRVTVTEDILVSSVTVSPSTETLTKGYTAFLHAMVCPSNATNKCVTWSSSNTNVAVVNPISGLVTAINAGTAYIYATAQDGSWTEGCCSLTVNLPIFVHDITLNRTNLTLYKENNYPLSATICPENATNKTIRWFSENPTVASVSAYTGRIYAKSAGETYIYATAQDGSGVCTCCKVMVKQTVICSAEENASQANLSNSPINMFDGSHVFSHSLMKLFGGQGLNLMASYDSTNLACGDLGSGWYHNYEKSLEVNENVIYLYNSPSVYSKFLAQSDCCSVYTCASPNKNGYVLSVDCSQQFPYRLNCNSDHVEYYNCDGYLAKIVDHEGFETRITYSDSLITVTDMVSGKKIYLQKDANCRVVRVYDDASRAAVLTYSGNHLINICDANGKNFRFAYDSQGRILSGTDGNGIIYFNNSYDRFGRLVEQTDAFGQRTSFVYRCDERITTDRNGNSSSRRYDCNGLLVSQTDENGNSTTYEYDCHYNLIRETDARGFSVTKTFNDFNKPTSITDRNGKTTCFTYDSVGNPTQICYPEIGGAVPTETFVYNSRNQLMQHTDRRGTVTVYTYDAIGLPATKKIGSKNAIQYSYQNGLLLSQTDARGNTTTYSYNAIGQMIAQTDANQQTTEFDYDLLGNLLKATDANGNEVTTVFDGNYLPVSVTDANGNQTGYIHNVNLKNTEVTLPDGNRIRYEYDAGDRLVAMYDQANNQTTYQYDRGGRLISSRAADGALVQYVYDVVGNVIRETNPKGAVTVKTYDGSGNVLSVTDPAGNTTTYQYNGLSKVSLVQNAFEGTTEFTYSPAGDLVRETDALGGQKNYTYDAYGNMLTATDARGNVTAFAYDANDNLISVTDSLNHTTTYTYNALNQLVAVTDANNNTVSYGYDALGRRTTVTDARGNVFTTFYDANGNVIRTTDANGNTVSQTTYNCLNLPVSVQDGAGNTTVFTYNALGKRANMTDSLNRLTEYTYNSRGQNTSVRNAANQTASATYDLLGNVTSLIGPLGGTTTYSYDTMGRLVSESTTSSGTVSYTYNELNIRNQMTNARGQVRQFFYDVLGRITGFTSPEGTTSFTYDANGNVLTVTDVNGTVTREFDALNRVTRYTDTFGRVTQYQYDNVGNLNRIVYPDNTAVQYAFDANHNLISVTDWANRVTTYTYNANNKVIGITKPDGSTTTIVYDAAQRVVSSVERSANNSIIVGFEYTYDAVGKIVEEIRLDKSLKVCYTYDNLNRVTKRTVKDLNDVVQSEENYSYDAAGNLTAAPSSSFAYDVNNRLTVFNSDPVSYDLDGNLLSATIGNTSVSFTYDSSNRLLSSGGNTYTYNAEGLRIRNLCGTDTTTYTYDTNAKLSRLLYRVKNGTVTKYVYGLGLIGEETQSAFKTYHFDSRGSTVAVTNASGTVTDTFAYDAYGNLLSRTGTSEIIFGYCGKYGIITDENGLAYMRARYYSPAMRRFVNADLLAGGIADTASLNRYAYANGNPTSNIDPYGLSPWSWVKEKAGWVGNKAKETYTWASGKVEDAAEWVSDKASEIGRAVTSAVTTATAAVTSAAVKAGEMIADGATKVKDAVVDAAIGAGIAAVGVTSAIVNVAKDIASNPEAVAPAIAKELFGLLPLHNTQKMTRGAGYIGSVIASIWNKDIRSDMCAIGWNPFNTDEDAVLKSKYVSFYKGSFVVRHNIPNFSSAGVMGMIFLNQNEDESEFHNTINHEWGHNQQELILGTPLFLCGVALPSAIYCQFGDYLDSDIDKKTGDRMYYSKIWERTADMLGGVDRENYEPFWSKENFKFW